LSTPDIFLSYNREDALRAKQFAEAFAAEGFEVWWDAQLRSGEAYDKVTEDALHSAKAVVVLWSKKSVDSRWVRAEATIGERNGTLAPAMIEPCRRPVMFELTQTAEMSHWKGNRKDPAWQAFVNDLRGLVGKDRTGGAQAIGADGEPTRRDSRFPGNLAKVAAALLFALVAVAGAWWWLRPAPAAAHSMNVRLSGFQLLSPDLAKDLPATADAEIAAAFNADGVVGVSTASTMAPGSAPAYALGGTIQRDGELVRIITNLTNERSGANLWSYTFEFDESDVAKAPRRIAVDAGNVVRCGLYGASTYHKALPDAVFRDYMQFCQAYWDPDMAEGRKALIPVQRVVAAVPDYSWGWAALAGTYWKVAITADNSQIAQKALASGREAADRAISIDSRNSEALYIKTMLIDWRDWSGREDLFKRALASRRLDCGCERHQYGDMLASVGRTAEAVEQLRQANAMLALYVYTPASLASALVEAGKADEAKTYFDAAIQLAPDDGLAGRMAYAKATALGDIEALADPKLVIPAELRAALLAGYRAKNSGDAAAKAQAVKSLRALPEALQGGAVALLLADLGATHEAFEIAARQAVLPLPGPSIFWYPSMRGTLRDPGFPKVVEELGLMDYWRASKTRPDACSESDPAPFCAMI